MSVDPPTAAALGFSPADVLLGGPGGITVYATAGTLGLRGGDDIDALCVRDVGTRGVFEPGLGDRIVFSLAPGSPSGAPDALFLVTTGAPVLWAAPSDFGLGAGRDNLNACNCFDPCDPCDANCDGSVDLTDVEPFILLLLGGDPCAECTGDTNNDGSVDLTDVEGFIACLLG